MAKRIEITLIGKPGCHLCEDATVALERVVAGFRAGHESVALEVAEVNMLEHADLAAKYAEEIPVVLIDGQMHSYWRVDEARLSAKLEELAND